ncbi:hypothetical protein ABZ918_34260 [Streptomyces viridosporus]|uniref:hypothetical protein n=1 Tax=Streptomyces viridosporus TaxID=67581 RepID=UPI0034463A47
MDIVPIAHDATDALTSYLAQLGGGVLDRVQNSAVDRLYMLVGDRLRATQAGAVILGQVEENPQDPAAQENLRSAVQAEGEANQEFATQLIALVREMQASQPSRGDYRASFNNSGDFQVGRGAVFAQGDVDQSKKIHRSGGWKFWAGGATALLLLAGGAAAIVSASNESPDSKGSQSVTAGSKAEAGEARKSPDSAKGGIEEISRKISSVFSTSGPVVCTYADGRWVATRYDSNFEKKAATFMIADLDSQLEEIAKKAGGAKASIPDPCRGGVSAISPDGKRIAVQVNARSDDSQSPGHVGWLDLTNGRFVDVTEKSMKSGYSPENHEDSNPGFSPEGDLWFLRDSQRFASADSSGNVTSRKLSVACSNGDIKDGYQVVGSVALVCLDPVHPNGKFVAHGHEVFVAGGTAADRFGYEVIGTGIETFADRPLSGHWVRQAEVVGIDGDGKYCSPTTWLNGSELLCRGGSSELYTVEVNPARAQSDLKGPETDVLKEKTKITPPTSRGVKAVVITPDRSSVYLFTGSDGQGDQGKIYRASLTNPGQPQEVGPLPEGYDPNMHHMRWNQ